MAKATHSVLFPASGDSFTIANLNNAFNALHQADLACLRARAHGTPDMGIMIGGSNVESYYTHAYASGDFPLNLPSGDITFTAPVSNPRIDLVYESGDKLCVQLGTEAVTPVIVRFPSGDTVIPICLVYHKDTEVKIVNYEDQGANPDEGYIYRDVRPIITPMVKPRVDSALQFVIDGGGDPIMPGVVGDIEVPFVCRIDKVVLVADTSGDAVIDIWKSRYDNFPPTVVNTICGATPPTLTLSATYQDSVLTGWSRALAVGDVLRFNVNSCNVPTRITASLRVTRT